MSQVKWTKTGSSEPPFRGRLSRTTKTMVQVGCECGISFPTSIYSSVNVTQDPDLQEALREGALQSVVCPFCKRQHQLRTPIIYHDEANLEFWLMLDEGLRHEELKRRSDLLIELSKEREPIPAYVRYFKTVIGFASTPVRSAARRPVSPFSKRAPTGLVSDSEPTIPNYSAPGGEPIREATPAPREAPFAASDQKEKARLSGKGLGDGISMRKTRNSALVGQ